MKADPTVLACRRASHLNAGADWRQRIHLREAAVDRRRLLNHDGGAGLTLRPRRRRGVGWLRLKKEKRWRTEEWNQFVMLFLDSLGDFATSRHTDLCIKPGFEFVSIWVQGWFSYLTAENTNKLLKDRSGQKCLFSSA